MEKNKNLQTGPKSPFKRKANDSKGTLTVYARTADLETIDNLVWLYIHHDYKSATRATVIADALSLLANSWEYDTHKKKFKDQMENSKLKVGRKSNKKNASVDDKISFSIYISKEGSGLMDNLVWIAEHILLKNASRGTIVMEAIQLLENSYNYSEICDRYKEHLPFSIEVI